MKTKLKTIKLAVTGEIWTSLLAEKNVFLCGPVISKADLRSVVFIVILRTGGYDFMSKERHFNINSTSLDLVAGLIFAKDLALPCSWRSW